MRQEWFVSAAKGTVTGRGNGVEIDHTTTVRIPAPEGEAEARAMADLLEKWGWGGYLEGDGDVGTVGESDLRPAGKPNVYQEDVRDDDPRFHAEGKSIFADIKKAKASK